MKRFGWLVVVVPFYGCVSTALGIFVGPSYAPIDRLLSNGAAYVKENPKDPNGYYTLGRTHYLAFATRAAEIRTYGGKVEPESTRDWNRQYIESDIHRLRTQHAKELVRKEGGYASDEFSRRVEVKAKELEKAGWMPDAPVHEDLANHAAMAKENLQKAIELDSTDALYHLALASLIEQYVDFLRQAKCDVMPEEFTDIISDKARDEYYLAYELAISENLKRESLFIDGAESLVGHEAGEGYIRLSERKNPLSSQESKTLEVVKQNVKKLNSLPVLGITPIIFAVDGSRALSDLLAPGLRVSFDLDGDGRIEKWPWVKPTTGILVWDPDRTGKITSGRQLFGSVTWWLFFADGYHALNALDDNRDGRLTGAELNGISVWFDRNSNGQADKGEVVTAEELGVTEIAAKARGHDGSSPMNPAGFTFKNGVTVPSYDWIASQDNP